MREQFFKFDLDVRVEHEIDKMLGGDGFLLVHEGSNPAKFIANRLLRWCYNPVNPERLIDIGGTGSAFAAREIRDQNSGNYINQENVSWHIEGEYDFPLRFEHNFLDEDWITVSNRVDK